MKKILFFLPVLGNLSLHAQERTIDTVRLTDRALTTYDRTKKSLRIPSEKLAANFETPTEVLRMQTLVAVRENGRGAVGSISMRGTSAAQTAFLWNGININSLSLGQADLNNLILQTADEMRIVPGGGAVRYGSGAMGGTVHVETKINFDEGAKVSLRQELGSYQTVAHRLQAAYSDNRFSAGATISRVSSENDFEIRTREFRSMNAAYRQAAVLLSAGYQFSDGGRLILLSEHHDNRQKFPIFFENQNKSGYESTGQKSLLQYDLGNTLKKWSGTVKLARIEGGYRYQPNLLYAAKSGAAALSWDAIADIRWAAHKTLGVNLLAEQRDEKLTSLTPGVDVQHRNYTTLALSADWKPTSGLLIESGLKQMFSDLYEPPLLFSVGVSANIGAHYTLKSNVSSNYRLPSFNDLFWSPGGNTALFPEHGIHADGSMIFHNRWIQASVTPFFVKIKNNIRWVPGPLGYWQAENLDQMQSRGVESALKIEQKWKNFGTQLSLGYAYTDAKNIASQQRMSYIPLHKATGELRADYRGWGAWLQIMLQSKTYTTADSNADYALPGYHVMNLAVSKKYKAVEMGIKIGNVTNTFYQSAPYHYQPPRHYSLWLNFNSKYKL